MALKRINLNTVSMTKETKTLIAQNVEGAHRVVKTKCSLSGNSWLIKDKNGKNIATWSRDGQGSTKLDTSTIRIL